MKKNFLVFFLLSLLIFSAYSNSLNSPFIWDDEALIVKNQLIRTPLPSPKILTGDLYNGISAGSNFYRPLQTLTYWVDFHSWKLEPKGYRLTNIILQILVSFAVFVLLCKLTIDWLTALAASLFFALNPLSTEAVTYISGRAEMLLGLSLIPALIAFIRSLESNKKKFLILSLVLFVSGLLSKELAAVFPLIILAYVYYFRKKCLGSRDFIIKNILPFFILCFIYLILRLTLLNFSTLRPPALTEVPFYLRISVLPKILLTYCKLIIFPVGLHMSRTLLRPVSPAGFFIAWFGLGSLVVLLIFILRNKQKSAVLPFMALWFVAFLLPQSGLFAINAFVSEHFLYLSGISLYLGLTYLLRKYLRKGFFVLTTAALVFYYLFLTFGRNYEWRDPLVFYKSIIRYSPDSFQAHNNLGLQFEYRGQFALAEKEYSKAISIKPDLLEAHSNLANLYFKMGMHDKAKGEYALVRRLAPPGKAGEIENNLGCIYETEGNLDEALIRYESALKLDPSLDFAHFNIARIYLIRKDTEGALGEVLKSLPQIRPDKVNTGIIRAYLRSAGKVNDGAFFYNDLGVKFAEGGDFKDSLAAFYKSLELKPLYADAHFNLGLAYWNMGQRRDAVFEFESALKCDPGHQKAKVFLRQVIYKK